LSDALTRIKTLWPAVGPCFLSGVANVGCIADALASHCEDHVAGLQTVLGRGIDKNGERG
jgi:hypothetical protein